MSKDLEQSKESLPSKALGKFKLFGGAVLIGLGALTAGCASAPPTQTAPVVSSMPPIKVTAVGYGATSSYEGYSPGQKRLMAMRASKLDAYRALAEQIQGVRVNGQSTVATMMGQVDSYRVFVDAHLRGAQVVAVTPMADGNYETTLEITLDNRFFNSFLQQARDVPPSAAMGSNIRGAVGPSAAYGTNFYYSE